MRGAISSTNNLPASTVILMVPFFVERQPQRRSQGSAPTATNGWLVTVETVDFSSSSPLGNDVLHQVMRTGMRKSAFGHPQPNDEQEDQEELSDDAGED